MAKDLALGMTSRAVAGRDLSCLWLLHLQQRRWQKVCIIDFEPDPVPDGYLEYVGSDLTLRSQVLRTNARQVGGLKPYISEMSEQYDRLELPIEAIHGTEDTIVPLSIHAQPLSERLTNVNLTVLDGVGHMPHHADQGAASAAIKRASNRAGLRD